MCSIEDEVKVKQNLISKDLSEPGATASSSTTSEPLILGCPNSTNNQQLGESSVASGIGGSAEVAPQCSIEVEEEMELNIISKDLSEPSATASSSTTSELVILGCPNSTDNQQFGESSVYASGISGSAEVAPQSRLERTRSLDLNRNETERETSHDGGPYKPESTNSPDAIDNTTAPEEALGVYWRDSPGLFSILSCLFGILLFGFDIYTDFNLSVAYARDGHIFWARLTYLVVVTAMFVTSLCNSLMFYDIEDDRSCFHKILHYLFTLLLLGPIITMFKVMFYGFKYKYFPVHGYLRDVVLDVLFVQRLQQQISLIFLMEAVLEAGPQLIIQLYVLVVDGWPQDTTLLVNQQLLSIVSSVCTLSWSLVRFQMIKRQRQYTGKRQLHNTIVRLNRRTGPTARTNCISTNCISTSCISTSCIVDIVNFLRDNVILMVWRICTISCRVLALSMFASCFPIYFVPVCLVHFIIMLVWIFKLETCSFLVIFKKRLTGLVFKIFMAFVYVFDFVDLITDACQPLSRTRLRALLYYSITYVENCVLICSWYIWGGCSSLGPLVSITVLLIVVVGFWLGMAFMGIYYMCCHIHRKGGCYDWCHIDDPPSSLITCRVPCSQLSICSKTKPVDGYICPVSDIYGYYFKGGGSYIRVHAVEGCGCRKCSSERI